MTDKTKTVVLAAVFFAAGCLAANTVYDIKKVRQSGSVAAKAGEVEKHLIKNGLYDYNSGDLSDKVAEYIVSSYGDEYSQYYTKEEFSSFIMSGQATYLGVGVTIVRKDDRILVVSVKDGSPAQNAGIAAGDYITSVNGIEYTGSNVDNAINAIKNSGVGSVITIGADRDGEKLLFNVSVESISKDTVTSDQLDSSCGYIKISGFDRADSESGASDDSTATEFKRQLNELLGKGLEKIVLDLRDNGGGDMAVAVEIADELLPSGEITYTIDKNGRKESYSSDSDSIKAEFVILANKNTASASEMLIGAMRDNLQTKVVGTKTYGKGVMQTVYPFDDGSGMKVTTAKYYTPNGTDIDKKGLEPDIYTELPDEYRDKPITSVKREDDTQLKKAVEILNGGNSQP